MLKRVALVLAVAGMLGLAAGARAASVTPVRDANSNPGSSDGSNMTLDYVLGAAYGYGGPAFGSVDTSLTWGGTNGITFTRIADVGGSGRLSLEGDNAATSTYAAATPTATDSVWMDGIPYFHVAVKYAGYNQQLGWVDYTNGGVKSNILAVTDGGLNPNPTSAAIPLKMSSNFAWYDYNSNTGNTWSSNPNAGVGFSNGGEDHMVTYRVTGWDIYGGQKTWVDAYVICFEDLPLNSSDKDYQDLVVQVSSVPVPLPAAAGVGFSMLAGFGVLFGLCKKARRSARIA